MSHNLSLKIFKQKGYGIFYIILFVLYKRVSHFFT
jgi:hypothetical protein